MANQRHRNIVVDISSHGFGHLGQIAPVIQRLMARVPTARIIVRTNHPASIVRGFIDSRVDLQTPPPETTLVMRGPTLVDTEASSAAYHALHANWDEHVDREAARLKRLQPSVLVADIPYLSLAAAKRIAVPAIAMCSLNWLDIFRTYCGSSDAAAGILRTIEGAYQSAEVFLQPQPHMPMANLSNRRSIGPVARIGHDRKREIKAALGIPQSTKLVLAAVGGIRSDEHSQLPNTPSVHWLIGSGCWRPPERATRADLLELSFIDVLASSDAVVTKVGYSTFVEAACNGVSVVSPARADWPESHHLIEWERKNANFALMDNGADDAEGLRAALSTVLSAPARPPVAPSGVAEASEIIAEMADCLRASSEV